MGEPTLIDKYAARIFLLSFFLPIKWQMIFAIGGSLYFVFRGLMAKQFPVAKDLWLALFLGGCSLLYIFALPFTPVEYRKVLGHICERRLSFLLMPLVFAIMSQGYKALLRRELVYFVYGCLVVCIAGNAIFFYHHYAIEHGVQSLSHVQYRIAFERITTIHPTYMGMYIGFSLCILMLSPPPDSRYGTVARYVIAYLLLVCLLSLLAKAPLIALVLIAVHYAWRQRKELYKYKLLFAGLATSVLAVYFFVPFFRQRLAEMLGGQSAGSVVDNSVSMRKLIFNTDIWMLKRYWLTGVGPGRMLQMLHEHYFFYSISNGIKDLGYYDPHNEYFGQWLSFGILGLLLLLAVLVVHVVRAIRNADVLYAYLMVILLVTFATESVLSRQHGVLFFGLFTSLFFFSHPARESKLPKYN